MRAEDPEGGYATAAATMVSLSIAVAVSGFMAYSINENRIARRELEKVEAEAILEGGHTLAIARIMSNGRSGRLRWTEAAAGETYHILAERESDKVDAASINASSELLRTLGAADLAVAAASIETALKSTRVPLASLVDTPLWRNCAPSIISYYGKAETPHLAPASPPDSTPFKTPPGAVWRVRVTAAGWTDERLVRVIGRPTMPASLISRILTRAEEMEEEEPCAALFTS